MADLDEVPRCCSTFIKLHYCFCGEVLTLDVIPFNIVVNVARVFQRRTVAKNSLWPDLNSSIKHSLLQKFT